MPAALEVGAVYITPIGRRCRWVPSESTQRVRSAYAFFQYLDAESAVRDGFNLTPQNYRLLRKESP